MILSSVWYTVPHNLLKWSILTLQIKKMFDMLVIQIAIFTFKDNLIFEIKMYYRCTVNASFLVKRYSVSNLRGRDP